MTRKRFGLALVGLVALVAVVLVTGTLMSGAGTANHVTICYNRLNGVVHYAPSGRCARTQTAVVVGRGVAGPRGVPGARGIAGGIGAPGPAGGTGVAGVQGPVGGTGAAGVNSIHMVVTAPDTNAGPETVTASCGTPGQVVTGGGFSITNVTVTKSAPNVSGDGWSVTFFAGPGSSSATAYANCVAGTIG